MNPWSWVCVSADLSPPATAMPLRMHLHRFINPLIFPPFSFKGCIGRSKRIAFSVRMKGGYKLFDRMPQRIFASNSDIYLPEFVTNTEEVTEIEVDRQFIISVLSICSIEIGRTYHGLIEKSGYGGDIFVTTSLIDMYGKWGDMESAVFLFDSMAIADVASCNCLISGYAKNGLIDQVFHYFSRIDSMGTRPNHYTYSIVLAACGTFAAIGEGMQLHAHIVKTQFLSNMAVKNSLLTMYSKCGMMEEVHFLFEGFLERNLISWTTIIHGLYQNEKFEEALRQFCSMRMTETEPNECTYTIALASCGNMKNLGLARLLHALVLKVGMLSSVFVSTAIIDMYAGLGEASDAERQFKQMGKMASNVSWNTLIAGFVQNEKFEEAMDYFHKMLEENMTCDKFTLSNILKACSSLPSLSSCKQIHSWAIKSKLESNKHVASSLIEAYAQCGCLEDAERVFNQTSEPDIVTWNSIIKGYSQNGLPRKAILFYEKMTENGENPTSSTFISILSACSHSGLIQEGHEFFKSMTKDYKIPPQETHYSCMIDLFGRAGKLEKALDIINNFPSKPSLLLWRPFLAACRSHRHLKMAEFAAKQILSVDPNDAAVYVTLSNMYAELGRTADAEKQRELMTMTGIVKEPGCSWIEVNNKIYKFFSGKKSNPKMRKVYAKLNELMGEIKTNGYISMDSETALYHSEKLAICFGILHLAEENPIRVFKNLRVCSDCHLVIKFISRITKREIVLRDNYRFHHFKMGLCSCGDYW